MSDAKTPGGPHTGEVGKVRCVYCGKRTLVSHQRALTGTPCEVRGAQGCVVLHDRLIHVYKCDGISAIPQTQRHLFRDYHDLIEELN